MWLLRLTSYDLCTEGLTDDYYKVTVSLVISAFTSARDRRMRHNIILSLFLSRVLSLTRQIMAWYSTHCRWENVVDETQL